MAAWSQLVHETQIMELQELTSCMHRKETISPAMIDSLEHHAAVLSESICDDFRQLSAIVHRHEALIDFRWHKKTIHQRRGLILSAWPDMPKYHRPDTRERSESFPQHYDGVIPDCFVWPFINQEDLVTPKTLLVFMSARGRMLPWEFAAIELEFSPVLAALFQGCPDLKLCDSLTIDFTEAVDPGAYGKVNRSCESSPKPRKSDDRYSLCARRAFQILLVQQRILSFLLACAKAILHDKTDTELFDYPVKDISSAPQTVKGIDIEHTSFTEVLNMAPYQGWNSMNLSQLRVYVESTYLKHKSHIWALREDPGYFADTLREQLNHAPINIPSDCGCHLGNYERPEYMLSVVMKTIQESYWMLGGWIFLKERLDKFDDLKQQHVTKEAQAKPLLEFEIMAENIGIQLIRIIYESYRSAPECRLLFKKSCETDTYHRVQGITVEQEEFLDLFETFHPKQDVAESLHFARPMFLSHSLEQVDMLIKRSETAKRLITGRVLDLLTDLSIITECKRQVSLWARSSDVETGKVSSCSCNVSIDDDDGFYKWQEALTMTFTPMELKPSMASIFPLKDKLYYPEHKRRTRNTITAMYNAEQKLDSLWHDIDAYLKAKTGLAQHRVIRDCLLDSFKMYRTAPWDEQHVKSIKKSDQEYRPIPNSSHNISSQFTGSFDRLSVTMKTKPKTRGDAESMVEEVAISPAHGPSTSSEGTFTVDRNDYKVFKALFHVPANESGEIPKCIKWNSFKRAMVHIGFSAESLQGSAWQFIPTTDVEAQRGIQFHEPHPENEIPYVMAKRFGRRLGRVYGWTGDTFQLA